MHTTSSSLFIFALYVVCSPVVFFLLRYAYHPQLPTGTCAALIYKEYRTLVAHLGAANVYAPTDLFKPENLDLLRRVKIIYVEGYFLTHSFEVIRQLSEFARERGTALACNVSGVYVCEKFATEIAQVVKCSDIVFGNSQEFRALATALGFSSEIQSSLRNIALAVSGVKNNCNPAGQSHRVELQLFNLREQGKLVVITQGNQSVICACGNEVAEYPICPMAESEIVDTTGAGDSFVAGFLTGIFYQKDVGTCVEWGARTAHEIIKQVGCSIPNHSLKLLT